jgi:integrase
VAKYKNDRYQLGDYWLGKRAGSPAWYRCWMVEKNLKRVSLQTDDFEVAKQRLNKWWADNYRLDAQERPFNEVKIADILDDYYCQHGIKLRSAQSTKIQCRWWKDWWKEATVADVRNYTKQEAFIAHLEASGLGTGGIIRVMEVGRAALRRAWKRGIIPGWPPILVPARGEVLPNGRPLTPEEVGKLIRSTAEPHIQLYILLALATAGRPEAITELTWGQVDFEVGLIKLNPEGRNQTSKRRPVVKLPDTLRGLLEPLAGEPHERLLMFRGKDIIRLVSGWKRTVVRSGLQGKVTQYSLRHTMARWMRFKGVPPWEVAAQLGHSMPQFSMSERYTGHSPDYLQNAVKAIDEYLALVLPAAIQLLAITQKTARKNIRLAS